jgi:hypothetical protein
MRISRFPLRPGVDLKTSSVADFKLSPLQRSLSTPTNHCGGNAHCALAQPPPAARPLHSPTHDGAVWCGMDRPSKAQRRLSGI